MSRDAPSHVSALRNRSPDSFSGFRMSKRVWQPVQLRLTAYALELQDPASGEAV